MIVYPAIDLRGGRVVRLVQGDPNRQTTYSDDPVSMGRRWAESGAAWLHVISLDGTLGEAAPNLETLAQLAQVGPKVQFGGGLRTLDDAQRVIDAGAARAILGTAAIQNPNLAEEAVTRFGAEAIAIALDARGGRVATHGWKESSDWTPIELGKQMAKLGVRHILYTDIERDGRLTGVNIEATVALAEQTGLSVIASGGVASLDDIHALKTSGKVAGVIIGQALYIGAFTLQEALALANAA
ncbi:MAG: 1-(5-phosphoribosyl)-5-[(5-phosphoribosylamino)methylideneamino]imidazole-4-carboxamide isomerase [Anaerolineae bacterium]|nr:1-(5-phosphoribosyl)-5-[(5-phosphoribosylamino)methylideneamino]imidazole-4-carboxamide isomerase [Anaerolineae bacterium]